MSILNNSLLLGAPAGSTQYQVQRSLRFNSSDSAYCSRSVSSAGNRKLWTLSMWVKRGTLTDGALFHAPTTTSGTAHTWCNFAGDILNFYDYNGSSYNFLRQTAQVFRDPSAWYHFVFVVDSDNATAANRARIYVNGSEITTWSSTSTAAAGFSTAWNNNITHQISSQTQYFNGYLAECIFVDGSALTPSSFGETNATTGQWVPKAYTGSYGTNGFKLDFADNSAATAAALGKDSSGNGNNWTPTNLSVTAGAGNDSLVDTPTSYGTDTGAGGEVRGNYCTWNPLSLLASATTSNGNLDASTPTANGGGVFGTIAFPASGKWYFEVTPTTGNSAMIGISDYLSTSSNAWAISPSVFYWNNGKKYVNGSDGGAYGATYAANDVIGVAVNCDSGSITFYKNNSSQGSISCSPGGLYPCLTDGTGSTPDSFSANFGQRPFAYTAPSGFKALCDTNLPTPVVAKPSTVFDTKLYTGNGSTQSITGLGFSPDFVWIKARSQPYSNTVFDAIRGATNYLYTDTTGAEATNAQFLTAFNSDGFSLGTNAAVNQSSTTYAAWTWDAGSSSSTNNAGSITSTVRANVSAGFSIVTWSGNGSASASVGHGLGVAPAMYIVKARNNASIWPVFTSVTGSFKFLDLSSTAAASTPGQTAPTSTTFNVVSSFDNANGYTYVAYCFAPVAGYSSFGSFVSSGSTIGLFVHLGFRPKWLMIKQSSTTGSWRLVDATRSPYNGVKYELYPNLSNAEVDYGAADWCDFLSNGFLIKSDFGAATYIYAAFAEAPFQYARAR